LQARAQAASKDERLALRADTAASSDHRCEKTMREKSDLPQIKTPPSTQVE